MSIQDLKNELPSQVVLKHRSVGSDAAVHHPHISELSYSVSFSDERNCGTCQASFK